jgi:hypothetical protein
MIGDNQSNSILLKLNPTGKKVGGVQASIKHAKDNESRAIELKSVFESVGNALKIPPALIAAMACRESDIGASLDINGYGDNKHAFGILQCDIRENTIIAGKPNPKGLAHITQAITRLKDYTNTISNKHPSWPIELQLQGAVASYNYGTKNCQSIEGIDSGTTNGDYSNDIIATAKYYAGY